MLCVAFLVGTNVSAYASDERNQNQAIGQTEKSTKASLEDYQIIQTRFNQNDNQLKIDVSSIGERTAELAWSQDDSVSSYQIQKYNSETKKLENYAITSDSYISLVNLAPNTIHKFVIESSISGRALGFAEFKTSELTPKLKVADSSSKGVKLQINDVEDGKIVTIYKGIDAENMQPIGVTMNGYFEDSDVVSANKYCYMAETIGEDGQELRSDVQYASIPVKMGLPAVSGSTKTYAHYTAVTVRSSPQYKLLNSSECYTDEETGIRMIDDCYCVALGSYYGSKIGTKYRIEFSTGNSIKVILCDQKANIHTDANNQYAMRNKDIMEFYVQRSKIPSNVRGNYGNLKQFSGSIVSIEKYV